MNVKPQTATFNTGRSYTPEGQIITATVTTDGQVLFHDHSRMIAGRLKWKWNSITDIDLFDKVMLCYDNDWYDDSSAARQLTPVAEGIHYLDQDRR